jgi:hypothetical protein
MKRNILTITIALLGALIAAGCGGTGQSATSKFPGTKDGARALLGEFLKPGADHKKLTAELRPTKEDYLSFYIDEPTATRAEKFYDQLWSSGSAVVAPKDGQTELKLFSATTEDLKNSTGESAEFPSSFATLAELDNIKGNQTFYAFKFVKAERKHGNGVRRD